MAQVDEASGADTPIAGVLAAGVDAISINQEITFVRYIEHILPIDGYRFWVRKSPAQTLIVKGSLHYASDSQQTEQENYTVNRVVFTSESEIQQMNTSAPVTQQ